MFHVSYVLGWHNGIWHNVTLGHIFLTLLLWVWVWVWAALGLPMALRGSVAEAQWQVAEAHIRGGWIIRNRIGDYSWTSPLSSLLSPLPLSPFATSFHSQYSTDPLDPLDYTTPLRRTTTTTTTRIKNDDNGASTEF